MYQQAEGPLPHHHTAHQKNPAQDLDLSQHQDNYLVGAGVKTGNSLIQRTKVQQSVWDESGIGTGSSKWWEKLWGGYKKVDAEKHLESVFGAFSIQEEHLGGVWY